LKHNIVIAAATALVLCWAAFATGTVASADTLGATCPDADWMKLSRDSSTGQEMVCAGAYPEPNLAWESTASGRASGFANLPLVGKAGSPCSVPASTFGQSSDGYVVWCSGGRALLPGGRSMNVTSPVWSLYSP
jgi:hypothetical protein